MSISRVMMLLSRIHKDLDKLTNISSKFINEDEQDDLNDCFFFIEGIKEQLEEEFEEMIDKIMELIK